jgi:predicted DsbA family dithiol-disulfide isomerase
VQTPVKRALFRRYFEAGEDISDPTVLRAVAEAEGMDGAATAARLAGDEDRAAVRGDAEAARRIGVTGVPTFVIDERYALVGAQPPETWARVADELQFASA